MKRSKNDTTVADRELEELRERRRQARRRIAAVQGEIAVARRRRA